jgi:hypothetical protein
MQHLSLRSELAFGVLLIFLSFASIQYHKDDMIDPTNTTQVVVQEHLLQATRVAYSTDMLHQAVQHTVCSLIQAKATPTTIHTLIHRVVDHALRFHSHLNTSNYCPLSTL